MFPLNLLEKHLSFRLKRSSYTTSFRQHYVQVGIGTTENHRILGFELVWSFVNVFVYRSRLLQFKGQNTNQKSFTYWQLSKAVQSRSPVQQNEIFNRFLICNSYSKGSESTEKIDDAAGFACMTLQLQKANTDHHNV